MARTEMDMVLETAELDPMVRAEMAINQMASNPDFIKQVEKDLIEVGLTSSDDTVSEITVLEIRHRCELSFDVLYAVQWTSGTVSFLPVQMDADKMPLK